MLEVLGSGGIGTVFKARQIDANRLIALKILQAEVRDAQEFKARFLREAQSLSKLRHPNIVTLYHLGISQGGLPYIAMEFIQGTTLRKILNDEEKLSVTRAIKISKQLCAALAAMHAEGIVHRDLKPENIVLMTEPEADFVKIIDFGLVRVEGESEQQKLTATGFLLGSVNYMSPEQCRGFRVDARSDIYTLGICFYEMLTGECPFQADSPVGIMYKHSCEAIPAIERTTVNTYHPAINALIQSATQKNTEERFQTAEQMSQALDALSETISGVKPAAWLQQPVIRILLATMFLTALLVAAVYLKAQTKTSASYEPLIKRKAPAAAPRNGQKLLLMNSRQLQEIIEDPRQELTYRVSAAIQNTSINSSNSSGLEAAKKTDELLKHLDKKDRPYYQDKAQAALAEALLGNGKPREAWTILERILPGAKSLERKQEYLKLIALHALTSEKLGKKKDARKDLKTLTNWEYGLANPACFYALITALRLKELAMAHALCSQANLMSDAAIMAQICRTNGHMELAEECIRHGLTLNADISVLNARMATKEILTEHAMLEIEQAWIDLYHNNKAAAQKRLESISQDKEMSEAIIDNTQVKKSIAEIMQHFPPEK